MFMRSRARAQLIPSHASTAARFRAVWLVTKIDTLEERAIDNVRQKVTSRYVPWNLSMNPGKFQETEMGSIEHIDGLAV